MKKAEQQRVIEGLLQHLDNGTNVDAGGQLRNPVSSYTCPDRAEQEWQVFFQATPQLLGLSSDLPEAGCFFTNNDLGKPILCTRDQTGQFRAFLNVCRHRGTVVETASRGKKSLFSCPFHAWGYNGSGELVAVPKEQQFGAVDRQCNSLVPLAAVERYGMLFVHPQADSAAQGMLDIDALLGDMGPELGNWQMHNTVHTGNTEYSHTMNWKLAIDTFGETYHFETLHRDTLALDFYGNCQLYDRYERNHRMMLCLRNIETLRDVPKEKWHVLLGALPVYYLFPNVQLIVGIDGITLVRVYPCGNDPHNSYSRIDFYATSASPEVERSKVFEDQSVQERMRGFAAVIEAEDYVAAASSHRGLVSGAVSHIVFGRNEPALHHYHNTYREALNLPPLPVS